MGDRHLSAKPAEAPAGKTAEKHDNSKELQMAPMNKRRNVGMEENKEVQEGTLLSILAYLGVLVLVPFIIGRENPTVRFHTNQGLKILVISIITGLFRAVFKGTIAGILVRVVRMAILILSIIGIINVIKKEEKRLPLVNIIPDIL